MIAVLQAWLVHNADDNVFWVDHDVGRRVCVWLEQIWRQEPALFDTENAMRMDIDRLLATLVGLGIPEARNLEDSLQARE
jgi:hypothetical protein